MLYKRKSDFTGNEIFTSMSPESGIKVYEKDIWLSDKWDPLDYGIDYDFSKPFFTQFLELMKNVPLKNLNVQNGVPVMKISLLLMTNLNSKYQNLRKK